MFPDLDPSYFYNIGTASLLIGIVFLIIGYVMTRGG